MMSSLGGSFSLAPEKAIAFFREKGLRTSFAWQDLWQREHDTAFTVAKMMNVDLLRDVKGAVDKALAEGQTLAQFQEALKPRLQQAGWWGRGEVTDPTTGEVVVAQLGSPRRLQTIFQTNLQTAYSAGHWEQIQETKASAPYLMYDAVMDDSTRPEHADWNGTVLPADDAWWETHMPPNGWNCRCGVIQLSAGQVADMGLEVASGPPDDRVREYQNPRTGAIEWVPQGIDPGWAYAPGASREGRAVMQLASKAAEVEPGAGAAVFRNLSAAEQDAFDSEHRAWVSQVFATPTKTAPPQQRVVGGLAVDDLRFLAARDIQPTSAAIWLEPRNLMGPKAARHEVSGNSLTQADWESLPKYLRSPEAVLFDTSDGNLLFVFSATGPGLAKVVVQIDRVTRGESRQALTINSVRTGFRVQRGDLLNTRRYELVRGAIK